MPIEVPDGVTVSVDPGRVSVKGPKGELSTVVNRDMKITAGDGGALTVERPTDRGEHRALHGLTRSLVANMVEGVTAGYEKRLQIQGVGYRAALQGKNLNLSVGFSHPVLIEAPEGIEFEVPQNTEVIVRGIDKQLVGEMAARIRRVRPPEPYKGKGIRYEGEQVRRKVGKRPMLPARNTFAFDGAGRRLDCVLGFGFATSKACILRPCQPSSRARQSTNVPQAVSI